ncbi:YciI family protein [Marimonas sp. MJW-29]|uniref:YciI family protein n=1 Tax=Sulfitobacter sediminis TaxID=3234186 RepID=A0ABV3RGU1_9RHOB
MKFIILFEDNPDADPGIRQEHTPDHLAFLERNRANIESAGPLFEAEGSGAGGIWILDAPDPEVVESLVHEDPFWPTGLRKSYRILQWKQVFADGERQI